jgi:hypothetical protein
MDHYRWHESAGLAEYVNCGLYEMRFGLQDADPFHHVSVADACPSPQLMMLKQRLRARNLS